MGLLNTHPATYKVVDDHTGPVIHFCNFLRWYLWGDPELLMRGLFGDKLEDEE